MKKYILAVLFCGLISLQAGIIYEQGLDNVVGGHDPFKSAFSYDDFTIVDNVILDKITINAHANFGSSDDIGDMDWEIRTVDGTTPGTLLYSGNVEDVIKTDTGLNYILWDLVDYTIDINDAHLTAGSYFLGVKANSAETVHLTLLEGSTNISVALVSNSGEYSAYHTGRDYAFRLESTTAATPEPSSYALMLLGLLGLVAFSRKQRAQQAA